MFEVGDVVEYVGSGHWVTDLVEGGDKPLALGTVLTVVEDDYDARSYFNLEDETVELWCVNQWPRDFTIISRNKPEVVLNIPESTDSDIFEKFREIMERAHQESETQILFKPVPAGETVTIQGEALTGLGVYRPNLEDRKVGKVQMHMVDDGFPNALKEIAKVMTWAAEVKGYKLHDWKNLPDADVELPSAAYRHRTENSIQKAAGLPALKRVDHESAIVHKAHELFNGLAELELILTGKIV